VGRGTRVPRRHDRGGFPGGRLELCRGPLAGGEQGGDDLLLLGRVAQDGEFAQDVGRLVGSVDEVEHERGTAQAFAQAAARIRVSGGSLAPAQQVRRAGLAAGKLMVDADQEELAGGHQHFQRPDVADRERVKGVAPHASRLVAAHQHRPGADDPVAARPEELQDRLDPPADDRFGLDQQEGQVPERVADGPAGDVGRPALPEVGVVTVVRELALVAGQPWLDGLGHAGDHTAIGISTSSAVIEPCS
jgi:hypothetical protein